MDRRFITFSVLALAVALLLSVNIVANEVFRSSRWDLTESQLFTLSKGTVNVLHNLQEPITLRLYLSKRLVTRIPSLKGYATRVEELLEEFKRQADGKIRLQVIDPDMFSAEEDRAVGYGIRGVPVPGGQEALYFGLVGTGSTTQEQVIPTFTPNREQFLEYDLSRLIYSLANEKKPVVGILSSLPINGGGPRAPNVPAWMVIEQAQQLFDIQPLDKEVRTIPEDIDVLLVVHPKDMAEHLHYAVDQFVLRGGRLLMFIDPFAEADQSRGRRIMGMQVPAKKTSNPERLLEAWGVKMDSGKIVGDISAATQVRFQRGTQIVTLDYPPWMNLSKGALNPTDIITGDLKNITVATAGYLQKLEGATTTLSPLLQTSEEAKLYLIEDVNNYNEPEKLLQDYQPAGERFVLAGRIGGDVKSAFPDGPPKPKEEESKKEAKAEQSSQQTPATPPAPTAKHLNESVVPANIILVADVDILQDSLWVNVQNLLGSRIAIPTAGNGSFVANALDNLAGSSDLIAIRSRSGFQRPFEYIDNMRQNAELKYRSKEQELKSKLLDAEKRLSELESEKQNDDALVLSEAQQSELINFRKQRLGIRKELREVNFELRSEIEALEVLIKFLNIALIPILIGLGGIGVGIIAMVRTRRLPRA